MALNEIISLDESNKLAFGDYTLGVKEKVDNFEVEGDVYKLKTFSQMTKLERNGRLLFESVPGTTVTNFVLDQDGLEFTIDGNEDAQVTVELETEQEYKLFIDEVLIGKIKANLAGKISFGADFTNGPQQVSVKKA